MEKYLVDFDGVIIDSMDTFRRDMKGKTGLDEWMEYLSSINWYKFLRECNEIDNSFNSLKELQELKKLHSIITRIHSFNEGIEKLRFIRENGINVPVLYTLPEQKKSEVFIPKKEFILIDDDVRNCKDWEHNSGDALLFKPELETDNKKIIKTLKNLL